MALKKKEQVEWLNEDVTKGMCWSKNEHEAIAYWTKRQDQVNETTVEST